ncbi:Transcriptional regulator TetR family [Patulibacter medicamentivorans]|uniref:Transcriptional regulator TetR family n=1 Tax=Patulibacter medicamentivorans TaxID=1097667 RepID=H0E0B4_9ACTN|nr:TetR/AcrR family transcriptional regulator [Patulibacter medicamentivorans]EHN12917.1 Transcriptional regulator TetR family [Patulibacter medicamentivorans]
MSYPARIADSGVLAPGRQRFSPRQEEVIDTVETLFRREGLRGVRMGDLATAANCSRSTLYEIAPSKEDLFLLVLDRMMRRISLRGAAAINEASSNMDRIRAMLTSGALDFADLGPRYLDAVRSHPPARMLLDHWIAVCRDMLEDLIARAIAEHEIRPVNGRVVAEVMFASVLTFTDPDFTRTSRVTTADALGGMVDLLLNGLRPR